MVRPPRGKLCAHYVIYLTTARPIRPRRRLNHRWPSGIACSMPRSLFGARIVLFDICPRDPFVLILV